MTESNNTEHNAEDKHVLSFGEHLYLERKRQNFSIADVAKAIHLSEKIIDALERSDVAKLPEPAFVQGYLRIYARYLGISEALVLEEYAHAVPHKLETELERRPTVRHQASSSSASVKMVTILLFVLTVAAALYATFSYYKEAMVLNEGAERDNQASLSLPDTLPMDQDSFEDSMSSDAPQQAKMDMEPAIISQEEDKAEAEAEIEAVTEKPSVTAAPESTAVVPQAPEQKPLTDVTAEQSPPEQAIIGDDVLELSTEEVTWLEVVDANGESLYYNLLQQGQSLALKGVAPFRVFLGNAPPVTIRLNDIPVNIEKRIRSNNIAQFSISVDQQQVTFH